MRHFFTCCASRMHSVSFGSAAGLTASFDYGMRQPPPQAKTVLPSILIREPRLHLQSTAAGNTLRLHSRVNPGGDVNHSCVVRAIVSTLKADRRSARLSRLERSRWSMNTTPVRRRGVHPDHCRDATRAISSWPEQKIGQNQ